MARQRYSYLLLAFFVGFLFLALTGYALLSVPSSHLPNTTTCHVKDTEMLWESVARSFFNAVVQR